MEIQVDAIDPAFEHDEPKAMRNVRRMMRFGVSAKEIKAVCFRHGFIVAFMAEDDERCRIETGCECHGCRFMRQDAADMAAAEKIEVETTPAGPQSALYRRFTALVDASGLSDDREALFWAKEVVRDFIIGKGEAGFREEYPAVFSDNRPKPAKHAESIDLLKSVQAACSDPSFMRSAIGSALSILEAEAAFVKINVVRDTPPEPEHPLDGIAAEYDAWRAKQASAETANVAEPQAPKELTFPQAMQALLDGKKVRNIGWRRKDYWIQRDTYGKISNDAGDSVEIDINPPNVQGKWEVVEDAPAAAVPDSNSYIVKQGTQNWSAVLFPEVNEADVGFGDTADLAVASLRLILRNQKTK